MLKTASSVVLGSSKSSMYPTGNEPLWQLGVGG